MYVEPPASMKRIPAPNGTPGDANLVIHTLVQNRNRPRRSSTNVSDVERVEGECLPDTS